MCVGDGRMRREMNYVDTQLNFEIVAFETCPQNISVANHLYTCANLLSHRYISYATTTEKLWPANLPGSLPTVLLLLVQHCPETPRGGLRSVHMLVP